MLHHGEKIDVEALPISVGIFRGEKKVYEVNAIVNLKDQSIRLLDAEGMDPREKDKVTGHLLRYAISAENWAFGATG